MGIRRLETTRGKGSGGEIGQQLLAKLVDLKLDFIFVNTGVGEGSLNRRTSKKWKSVLFILELISELQAFYFYFSLPFVFEDSLIRFSIFWGCRFPCCLVIVALMDTET